MSRPFKKIACALAGLAVAALAAGGASAARPIAGSKPDTVKQPLSVKQKNDLAAAMARNHNGRVAPKTMAQAAKTVTRMAKGGEGAEVSEDLHNYFFAVRDAQGNLRILESDGVPQPGMIAAEVSNEK